MARVPAVCCLASKAAALLSGLLLTFSLTRRWPGSLWPLLQAGSSSAPLDADAEIARMHFQWYRRKIMEMDMGAVRAAKARSRAPRTGVFLEDPGRAARAEGKLAFLFLLRDVAEQEAVWDEFFRGADAGQFSVYVHRSEPRSSPGSFEGLPNSAQVPYTRSDWCALMGVEVAALLEALRDPRNQQFAFVSHNAVPLKSFDYVYQSLVAGSASTSKFCFAAGVDQAGDCRFRDENRDRGARVLKHHQWVVLSRAHAEAVVARAEGALLRYDALREERAGRYRDPKMCSDESVPVMALLDELPTAAAPASPALRGRAGEEEEEEQRIWRDLERLGVEQRCTTFTYWTGCMTGSPLELPQADAAGGLHPHAFREVEPGYLRRLVEGPLLFARKFPAGSVVRIANGTGPALPLRDALPAMWAAAGLPQDRAAGVARLDASAGADSRRL